MTKELLKFITCGSVDDGKSTLIGHMLYDAKLLFTDQKRALELESRVRAKNGKMDYSLLLDGLLAEREQGITIDVAYRYFCTRKRKFIVADTPGHEEYTRNMAVWAFFADLAIVLVDASKGLLLQTRRHCRICALMGIKHFVFAINKMDVIHFDQSVFFEIQESIQALMLEFLFDSLQIIPVSATDGDNLVRKSLNTLWYEGLTLLDYLENVNVEGERKEKNFVMPVQRVCRPNSEFRGFQGQIADGCIHVGEEVKILPSNEKTVVTRILSDGIDVEDSMPGESITLVFDREVDASRGMVVTKDSDLGVYRFIRADVLWMDYEPLIEGCYYLMKIGTKKIPVTILKINYLVDFNTGSKIPPHDGYKNDLLNCDIGLSENVVLAEFEKCHELGKFILINRISNATSACGIIKNILKGFNNLAWQNLNITRDIRSYQKNKNR